MLCIRLTSCDRHKTRNWMDQRLLTPLVCTSSSVLKFAPLLQNNLLIGMPRRRHSMLRSHHLKSTRWSKLLCTIRSSRNRTIRSFLSTPFTRKSTEQLPVLSAAFFSQSVVRPLQRTASAHLAGHIRWIYRSELRQPKQWDGTGNLFLKPALPLLLKILQAKQRASGKRALSI